MGKEGRGIRREREGKRKGGMKGTEGDQRHQKQQAERARALSLFWREGLSTARAPSLFMLFSVIIMVVSVAVAVPLASWGTTAATRVTRLRIGERPREWTRG